MRSPKAWFKVPFPSGWFHPRCRAPWAQRWGAFAEYLLSRHNQRCLKAKPAKDLNYVTMASRGHWLLLRESLVSLHRTWGELPKLTVMSDGSWKPEEFQQAFDFWPTEIEVLMPGTVLPALEKSGDIALASLARSHPLGLKLATVIHTARRGRILFVDSDILWFADPAAILRELSDLDGPTVSVESTRSYNPNLVRKHAPELFESQGINSGCIYLRGDLCDRGLLDGILATALQEPEENFNEQSIVAVAVAKGGRTFAPEMCLVAFEDALVWRHRKPWNEGIHARHYVNWMRHQFHRDALARRMGFRL